MSIRGQTLIDNSCALGETTTTAGMAEDGIHPSAEGYAAWADGLSRRILASQAPGTSWSSG